MAYCEFLNLILYYNDVTVRLRVDLEKQPCLFSMVIISLTYLKLITYFLN